MLHRVFTQDLTWGKIFICLLFFLIIFFCCHFWVLYSQRIFHISVSWWCLVEDWVTASLFWSPGLFSVLWFIQIIIIISCRQHRYPWLSLSRHSSLSIVASAGLQGYIPYPHRAAACMFELVVLLLLSHMWGSAGVHHLWAIPCYSNSVLHVWFV